MIRASRILHERQNLLLALQASASALGAIGQPSTSAALAPVLANQSLHQPRQPLTAPSLSRGFAEGAAGPSGGDMPPPMVPMAQRQQQAPATQGRSNGKWTLVVDEASGERYYWQKETGLTTPLGAPNPDAWVVVKDHASAGVYYWNKESGETTAVGEPMPGPEGRMVATPGAGGQAPPRGFPAMQLIGYPLAMGVGVGLVFGLMRAIF